MSFSRVHISENTDLCPVERDKIHGRDVVYDFAMIHDVYGELQWQASEIIIFIRLWL